ncbi:DUF6531 domain-containing protein [Curtobacterium sp. 18060]|uniref:DUF6531 domain-containing protein n=1 Tax=Curtobacterium sp. 18060 TaxID=2681408 RepID=UPI0013593681|nr:DUF6531 domain-containing protein [Curtobacterium sp. 18060]
MTGTTDLTAYALPDLTYDFSAADDLARQCDLAKTTVELQSPSRAALVTLAGTDFAGGFAETFRSNAQIAQEDARELTTKLGEVASGIRALSDAARAENTRRREARAWRDRVMARRTDLVDSTWDQIFGEEPPPSSGKVDVPAFPSTSYTARTRSTPTPGAGPGTGGSVSSARPDRLRAFASGSASLNGSLQALPGRIAAALAAFTQGCDFGRVDLSTLLAGFRAWSTANEGDVDWANTIAAAFEAAGASGDVVSLNDTSLLAALLAAGVGRTRTDLDFGAPSLLGAVPTSGFAADPVNTATGNFVELERDLSFAGGAEGFELTRLYNSFDLVAGSFGRGWSSVLDKRLEVLADHVELVHDDGRRSTFPTRGDIAVRAVGENLWLAPEPDPTAGSTVDREVVLVVRDNAGSWWSFTSRGVWIAAGTGTAATTKAVRDGDDRLVRLQHRRGRFIDFLHRDGLVRSARSSDGRTVTYDYADDGALRSVTGPGGTRTYTWEDGGRIERVTAADGVVECANIYDQHGRVLLQTTPQGRTIRFAYLPGRVTSVADEDGTQSNTWTSDRHGRVVAITDADGRRQSLSHDEHGNLVASTARDGSVAVHEYDDRGRLTRTVAADGTDTVVAHDDHDRVHRIERDGRSVSFTYADPSATYPSLVVDERGARFTMNWVDDLLVRVEDPEGVVLMYEYDVSGDLVAVTDALGGTTLYTRDHVGQVITTTTPLGHRTRFERDAAGLVTSCEAPDGSVWTFERDAGGRVISVADPVGGQTTYEYGTGGSVTRATDPLGRASDVRYDNLGNLHEILLPDGTHWKMLHDALSRLREVTDPAGGRWLREYDAVGRPTARIDPAGVRSVVEQTDRPAAVPFLDLDLAGRVVAGTSPLGDRTTIEYDVCGRLSAWTDADGGRTMLGYDADSRIVERIEPSGAVTTFEYDACSRLVAERVPGIGTTRYGHDPAGRLVTVDDSPNGRRTITRDIAGQAVAVDDALGHSTTFHRDVLGRVTQMVGPSGGRTLNTWTGLGDMASTTDPMSRAVTWTRDAAGRPTARTNPDGHTTTWTHDPAGRLTEVRQDGRLVAAVARDESGRSITITDRTHPDGEQTEHRLEYGARHELLRRTTTRAGRSMTTGWEYDAAGNQRAITTPDGVRTEYDRGRAGILTGMRRPDFPDASFRYDGDGRLTEVVAGSVGQSWQYRDGFVVGHVSDGRKTTLERDSRGRVAAVRDPDGMTVTYEYDEASQLVAATGTTASTWTYDRSGRMVEERDAFVNTSYLHDATGALLQTESRGDGTAVVRFEYDSSGRRVLAATDDGTTTYVWDELGQLRTVVRADGVGVKRSDLWVNALGELAEVNGTTLCWDPTAPVPTLLAIGDVPIVTAPGMLGVDGSWITSGWRRSRSAQLHDPWFSTDVATSPRLPDGIEVSPTGTVLVGGLELSGARAYDPSVRSFLSPDPLPPVAGAAWADNPYAFSGNDPVNQTDPTGLRPITDAELAAYGAGRQGLLGISYHLSNNGAFSMDGDLHASHALSWLLGMSLLDPRMPGPGVVLGALSPLPLVGIPVGMAADFYAGTVLTSGQGEMLFGWATGTSPRTLLYGSDSKMTQVVRNELPGDQRRDILDDLKDTGVATGYGYQAGPASLTNQNLLRDIRTVVTWPVASERDRTLLALGTYDVDAKVVSKGDDGTTVVEYTATNETTLGSALRIPGLDYDALNRAAGDHGPFSRVTERFTWTEKVKL